MQIWIFAIDYPLALTILHQFLHPKAKKQSPTRGLQHLTFSSALSQQQLLCWCCSSPLLFEAPFPTVTGQGLEHDMHDIISLGRQFMWLVPQRPTPTILLFMSTVSLPWPTCLPLFLQSSAVEPQHQNVKLNLSTVFHWKFTGKLGQLLSSKHSFLIRSSDLYCSLNMFE